jgi:5-methyltetrahydropteroyltriglutamate--homocysteine methyltransferase
MQRRVDRILTTHTGSLPRPRDLVTLLREREEGRQPADEPFHLRVRAAVAEMVRRQAEIGVSIVNDGEQGRADYTVYVKDRLTGFDGETAPLPNADAAEFPEWTEMARQFAPPYSAARPARGR